MTRNDSYATGLRRSSFAACRWDRKAWQKTNRQSLCLQPRTRSDKWHISGVPCCSREPLSQGHLFAASQTHCALKLLYRMPSFRTCHWHCQWHCQVPVHIDRFSRLLSLRLCHGACPTSPFIALAAHSLCHADARVSSPIALRTFKQHLCSCCAAPHTVAAAAALQC